MKNFLLKTWLLLVCLLCGAGTMWAEDYVLTTTITDGEYVIGALAGTAGTDNKIYAFNTTDNSSWGPATEITPSNGKISNPASSTVWTLTTSGTNGFTLKNGSNYYYIGTGTGSGSVRVKTTSTTMYYVAAASGTNAFEVSGVSTFTLSSGNQLGYNIGSGYRQYAQRTHGTGTTSGSISTQIRFYKKVAPTVAYTVTFNAGSNGSCSTTSLTEASAGAGVTLPNVTANEGWAFQGWSTSSTPTSANAGVAGDTYKPSANTTLYAYYKVIPVAPSFSPTAGDVEKGTSVTFSSTTEGCTFRYTTDGTNPNATTGTEASSFVVNEAANLKVVAVKDGIASAVSSASYTVATHTATFNVNGNVTTAQVAKGDAIPFPANPQANDVTFVGWTKNAIDGTVDNAPSDICTSASMGTDDVTYYAVFAEAVAGNTFTQITALNALEAGARYLIVGNSSSTYKALPVDKAETLTTVTPSSSKITNPAEELIWTLEGTAKNWKIKSVSNGKYLQISGGNLTFESSTSLTFDASVSSSKFTFTSSAASGNKVLSYYASGSKFNAYTTANNVYLYKASVDYSDYCTTVKAVTSVAVKTVPTTVAYCEGEKFNPEGLEVTLTYEDATTKDIAYSDATASKFAFAPALDAALSTSDDHVAITINGQTANQAISVRSVSIAAPVIAEGTYTVKVGDAAAVTADGNTINALKGQKVVLASTPADGYKVASTPFVVTDEDDANVSVSTAGGQYSFTMPGKNVTITAQFTRVYTITAGSCENGSITAIKDKDDAEITETSKGSKVVVEATADTHYHLTGMYYMKEGEDTHNEIIESEGVYSFTMPQSNVTVYATFADDTQYTISWMVNGAEAKSEQVYADVPVSAPAVDPINSKVFRGWVAEEINGSTNDAPSFVNVTNLTVNEDKVFYAVFATETGSPETHNIITYETENFPSSYAAAADYTLNGVSFNIVQAYINGQKTQWRAAGNKNGTGTMYNNDAMNLNKITLTYDGDDNKNFTIKVGNSANPTSGTEITGVVDSNDENVYVFDCSSENASYFVLTNGTNAGYLASIDITCGGATYSDYTTKVTAKTTPTLSFAEAIYNATMGEDFDAPELTNPQEVSVTYSSSAEGVATVDSKTGAVTLVGAGTTTITATFTGNENYLEASARYTLVVEAATTPEPTPVNGTLNFVATNNDSYWATFTSTDNVIFDANDVVVYTVAVEGKSVVKIKATDNSLSCVTDKTKDSGWVAGYYVQAGSAVLINSVDQSVNYYYVDTDPYTPNQLSEVETDPEYNMLRPASVAKETDGSYLFYKLAYGDWENKTKLGFWWGAEKGGPFESKAGGVYLAVPVEVVGNSNMRGFSFEPDTRPTGIESISNDVVAGEIYNLQGQRINRLQQGVNIVNGKKVIR